jgi:predicted DNA binding CopG/RHH family protein
MAKKMPKKAVAHIANRKISAKIQKATDEYWDADKMITVRLDNCVDVVPGQPLIVEMKF